MQLGFLEFEVTDRDAWDHLLTAVIGLAPVVGGRYRLDRHAWRIQLRDGPADDLSALGWELAGDALDETVERLRRAGVEVTEDDPDVRTAERRFLLEDPGGIPTELVTGMARGGDFHSPLGATFVADALGLGHVVVTAPDKAATARFYQELLGFRLSDHIVTTIHGHAVDLTFLHANPRHHSVAFGGPLRQRLHHFMLEVTRMDDVGLAYDRCIRHGVPIMQTLGRHPNDRMFSFYARTPSRIQFELGWGGREVDDAVWEPETHDRVSEWGHHPPRLAFAGSFPGGKP